MSKVFYLSEMEFKGTIPRDNDNRRTEFSQMIALKATHYPILKMHKIDEKCDHAIICIGKGEKFRKKVFKRDILAEAKRFAHKIWIMQEGPHWIFQDYDIKQQKEYFKILSEADGILAHNRRDQAYYQGLFGPEKKSSITSNSDD